LTFALLLAVSGQAVAAEDGSAFTSLGPFQLGKATLPDIQRDLGPVKVVHTGDAGETLYTVCYRVGATAVLFMSGELDGPDRYLGGVRVTSSTDRTPCRTWPTSRPAPSLSVGGIRIGTTLTEARTALGHPVVEEDGKLTRTFITVKRMSEEQIERLPADARKQIRSGKLKPEFDVMVAVTVRVTGGKVTEVEVWKSETW